LRAQFPSDRAPQKDRDRRRADCGGSFLSELIAFGSLTSTRLLFFPAQRLDREVLGEQQRRHAQPMRAHSRRHCRERSLMQFLRLSRGGVDGCAGQSKYRRIVATTSGCVKLAYDTDSALGIDLNSGSPFWLPSVAEFAAELANAASGNGARPPPIVSRQASRESQSS
jgi:hypothetical protein